MGFKTSWVKLRSSWVWLLGLYTLGTLFESMFFGQVNAFAPLYLPQLGIAPEDVRTWTGLIVATANLAGIPFLPFWGALADRYSRKPVIIRSFAFYVLSGFVLVMAGNIWVFLLGRIIGNLALGNTGLMLTTLSERTPANRQGFAFAVMNSATPIGAFLGPLVGGPLFDTWGFQGLMTLNIPILVIVVFGMAFGYRDTYTGHDRGSLGKMALDSVKIIMNNRRIKALILALLALFSGWVMTQTYVPLAINELYHGAEPGKTTGIVMGMGGLTSAVIAPLLGALADRFGRRKMLLITATVEMVLFPIPALAGDITTFAIFWALINGVGSGVFALSFGVLSHTAPEDVRGRVMAFAFLPANLGFMIGPALGSLISQAGIFWIFPAAAVLTGIGIILLRFASR